MTGLVHTEAASENNASTSAVLACLSTVCLSPPGPYYTFSALFRHRSVISHLPLFLTILASAHQWPALESRILRALAVLCSVQLDR